MRMHKRNYIAVSFWMSIPSVAMETTLLQTELRNFHLLEILPVGLQDYIAN